MAPILAARVLEGALAINSPTPLWHSLKLPSVKSRLLWMQAPTSSGALTLFSAAVSVGLREEAIKGEMKMSVEFFPSSFSSPLCSTLCLVPLSIFTQVGLKWDFRRHERVWNTLEHLGTSWNLLEHFGTFWNFLIWNILEHVEHLGTH